MGTAQPSARRRTLTRVHAPKAGGWLITTVTVNPSLDEWLQLPRLRVGELNRATGSRRYPGGKGINVSRVVHELGEATLAVACAGGDDGTILTHLLNQQHIPHRVVTVAGSTRNNYQIRTEAPPALTQINCAGPRLSAEALAQLERLLCRLQSRSACMVFSGSLPPGATATTYQRLIHRVKRGRILTALDASGPALRAGLSAGPWFAKPNRPEAEELLGVRLRRRTDIIRAAKELVRRGPSLVMISLGAEGAVLASRDRHEVWWGIPPRVRVNSTVGAGDSTVAGFLVGWLRTRSLVQAFRLGLACGAAAVLTPGTELCHAADIARLKPRITIRSLPSA